MTDLGSFEGKPVRKTSIEVSNTGYGLSNAVKTNPTIVHAGERRFIVFEVDMQKIRFDPMDDGDAWNRVHLFKAGVAAFLEESLVVEAIEQQKRDIIAREEEAKNLQQIPEVDRAEEHRNGQHKRVVRTCELCLAEAADRKTARDAKKSAPKKSTGRGAKTTDVMKSNDATVTDIGAKSSS